MAFTPSFFATSMLLLALLVIASATDYGYVPTPNVEQPKPVEQPDYKSVPTESDYKTSKPAGEPTYKSVPAEEPTYKSASTKPDYKIPKPAEEPTYKPVPSEPYKIPKPAEEPTYKPVPSEPDYKIPQPESEKDKLPLLATVGVQGLVLCKSGSKYFPIQGAVARVTCLGVDEYGHEFPPFSALSHVTDNKGYFLATLSLSELQAKLKIIECKAFLESSPLESCNVPTDVNYGRSGVQLSKYRLLVDNIKLYSVGPFIYTSQTPQPSSPNDY